MVAAAVAAVAAVAAGNHWMAAVVSRVLGDSCASLPAGKAMLPPHITLRIPKVLGDSCASLPAGKAMLPPHKF